MDPSASYRCHRSIPYVDQGDGEEIPPELEMRLDPQESLAQHDEAAICWIPLGLRCCSAIL
jgi:hypothetical protein